MTNSKLKAGFTLVEILIVLLIIALLLVFIVPQVLRGVNQARDTARISHLNQIALSLDAYKNAKGQYPQEGCLNPDDTSSPAGALIDAGFLSRSDFPVDPDKNAKVGQCSGTYLYRLIDEVTSGGQTVAKNAYAVFSVMETNAHANADQSDLTKSSTSQFNNTTNKKGYFMKKSF